MIEKHYTIAEVAREDHISNPRGQGLLPFSRYTIWRMAKKGDIRSIIKNRGSRIIYLIPESAINEYLKDSKKR